MSGLWAVLNNAGIAVFTVPDEWMTLDDYRKVSEGLRLIYVVFCEMQNFTIQLLDIRTSFRMSESI